MTTEAVEFSVKDENPNFKCEKCGLGNILYAKGQTYDGAYDIYKYRCQDCNHRWRVTDETD